MNRILFVILITIASKAEAQSSALELGNNLFLKGNYSKAIIQYKTYSHQEEIYDKIARAYQALGNNAEALSYFEKAIDANPDDELILYEYGKLLRNTKKNKASIMVFNQLIAGDSLNPNYHYQQGLALQKIPDSADLALSRFKTAFDLDNTHQKAIYKLARHFLKKKKHSLVDKYVSQGFESYPNNPSLVSLKAQNFYWKEDYVNAIKWFEKLIALGESTELIHEKLSLSYAKEYDFEKAIKHRKRVLEYNPTDATSMFVIGQYYEQLRDFVKAEKYVLQFLALTDLPLDEEYSRLGRIYNYQKKYKEAIDAFKTALRENPKNELSQFFLAASMEAYYKDFEAKLKVYEDFIKKYPNHKMLEYAKHRVTELKKEKFLKEE